MRVPAPRTLAAALATALTMGVLAATGATPLSAEEDPTRQVDARVLPARSASAAGRSMVFPIEGSVRYRDDFGATRSGGRQHKGNDLFAAKMQRILAARTGIVTFVRHDTSSNAGNMLVLRDPEGWEYWYMHINNDSPGTDDGRNERRWAFVEGIQEGSRVVAGQHLGFVGDSGNAEGTNPHLHFELHRPGGEVVNPNESLLTAPRVSAALGRAVALHPGGGYYVLTRDGAVHAFDGAPHFGSSNLFGAARSLAVMPDGGGYLVLDDFGGVHHFGSATSLRALVTPYWPGQALAKDVAVTPSGTGLAVLDAFGGVHSRGDAPAGPGSYWPGWDIARGLAITPSGQGIYVLDGFGGVIGSGDATARGTPYFAGSDRVRGITASGNGYSVITDKGRVYRAGDARRSKRGTPGGGWRALDTLGDRLVVLRGDAVSVTP